MTFDWSSGSLAEGLACYRQEEFFEAHEHWESVWLTLQEPEKSFLQSLIQITAAFHHLRSGNRAGAASLLRRSLNRLSRCPSVFGGIEVEPLREEVAQTLHQIIGGSITASGASPHIRPVVARLD